MMKRVAHDKDEIGPLAGREGSLLVGGVQQGRWVLGCRRDRLERRQARFDEKLELSVTSFTQKYPRIRSVGSRDQ